MPTTTISSTAPAGDLDSGMSESQRASAAKAHLLMDASMEEFSAVAGIVNAGHGRLVDLATLALAEGHHVGPGLHTAGQYVAWQTGMSKATANRVVRVARRAEELPHVLAALRAGEISLDQAEAAARLCPARYDRSIAELAKYADVTQLEQVLRNYRDLEDPKDDRSRPKRPHGVSIARDDDGEATITAHVSGQVADAFERALQAMADDLRRQREADARSAAAEVQGAAEAQGACEETSTRPASRSTANPEAISIEQPTSEEALAALCETTLQAGQAAHPGSERYLLSYHLHTDALGRVQLTDARGRVVPAAQRRQLLCDHAAEAMFHGDDGAPLSAGRKTRAIGPKLRRAILFRHHHRCAVPGCDASVGLEIHHVQHWEDGGVTDTHNVIAICGHHHRAHHRGLLLIEGDADLPMGTPGAIAFTTPDHRPIPDSIPPEPLRGPITQRTLDRLRHELARRSVHRHHTIAGRPEPGPIASTPTGERLDRSAVHLTPNDPSDLEPPDGEGRPPSWLTPPCTGRHRSPAPPPSHHRPLRT